MVSFEEAFEQTGYGLFNHIVLIMSGLALMFTNVETLGIGYIIATAHCDLGLSSSEEGMINAAAFMGVVATAMVWGYLSDRFGRRTVMLPAILISSGISVASSFSINFWMMFLLRFLTGSLASGLYTWMPNILNEMLFNVNKPINMCDVMSASNRTSGKTDNSSDCKQKTLHHLLYPISIIMGVICAATYAGIGFLMRRYNKIIVFCTILVSCSLLIAMSSLIPQLWVAICMFITGLSSGCVAAALAAISVDVFPTSIRALALCTLYMCGRLGAAVGANLLGLCLRDCCTAILLSNTLVTAASTLLWLLWPDVQAVRAEMENKGFSY